MTPRRSPAHRIGIDLGGTKIEGIVLDPAGRAVRRHRIATESGRGYEHILGRVEAVVDMCRQVAPDCEMVGIGTPGAVRADGTMKNCNTTCLNGRQLPRDLTLRLGLAVRLENDANCFALAEAVVGAGRGAALVFGVIVGTGVGGGIVYRGELLRGLQHIAGEWGHHGIDPDGPECYCGQRGCVERWIAGPAIEAQYAALAGRTAPMPEIAVAFRNGEPIATQIMHRFFDRFGRAMANVIAILDPDVIVLGGGLSHIAELYTLGRDAIAGYVFNDELRTPLRRNLLGDSAGVIGAAMLVDAPAVR